MAKHLILFRKDRNLNAFLDQCGAEEQCADALFGWRWPTGFVCPAKRDAEGGGDLRTRNLMQGKIRHQQTSLTAGPIYAYSRSPLTTWFLNM